MSRLELIDAVFQDHLRNCVLCGSNGPAACKKGLAILEKFQEALLFEDVYEKKAA